MLKKSRIRVVALALLASSLVFVATTRPSQAFFLDPFENVVENMMQSMLDTMLALSDDIGVMADRILLMADNILIMADKIGEMSDRIVATEQLMADLVRDVTATQGPSTLLLAPAEGDVVSLSTPITVTLSNGASSYLLYLSNSPDMSNATNALVQNGDTASAWSRATSYAAGSELYVAVKAVNGDVIGALSNTVRVQLVP